jgi:acylphosphatase
VATRALKLTAMGRVQRVGYRRYLLDIAQEQGLAGYVRNEKDGSVTIFVQGSAEKVANFEKMAGRPPPPAAVTQMRRVQLKPRPGLRHFGIRFGSTAEELQEGFGAMQTEFRDYRDEFRDYRTEFKDYKKEFRDYRTEFRDYRDEFRDYRTEFKDYKKEFREFAARTDENFVSLGDKIDRFAADTGKNFVSLEQKYGEISEKLSTILETLQKESAETRREMTRAVDNLSQLVDQYIRREGGGG